MYQSWFKEYDKIVNEEDKMKVEEAINIINRNWLFITKHELDDNNKQFKQAIETLWADREKLKNRCKNCCIRDTLNEYINESISKQKIREKIEELYKQDKEWTEELSEPDSDFKNIDLNLKRIKNQIDILEELLKESD